jgi:hypothetical protein
LRPAGWWSFEVADVDAEDLPAAGGGDPGGDHDGHRGDLSGAADVQVGGIEEHIREPVSNVPGPPVPLYLAGAKLLEIFPVVPLVGNQTLNVGVLSYAGQLNMTAVADGDACPDIDVFAQGVRHTVEKLARSVVAT